MPGSLLLIPAFSLLSWLCPGRGCLWPSELMGSWLGPWRQSVFLPRNPVFLLQLQAPAGYRLSTLALRRPQHAAATGVCFVTAGLASLTCHSCLCVLVTHPLPTSLINPDEGLRIHLNTALQATTIDDMDLGPGCWGERLGSESAACATWSL